MRRMISIVDLATGRVSELPSNTPTFDVPQGFAQETPIAVLNDRLHAHSSKATGAEVKPAAFPRPLSWRVQGEECLVDTGGHAATPSHPSDCRLCAIEPDGR
jgi:hypothetical protein